MAILLTCPNCNQTIESNEVNMTADLVLCTRCRMLQKALYMVSVLPNNQPGSIPKGSSIKIKKTGDNLLVLAVPRMRLSFAHVFQLLFVVAWFAAIGTITFGLYQMDVYFPLIMLPFWLVGLSSFIGLLNALAETQKVTIDGNLLIVDKRKPFFRKRTVLHVSDIIGIEMTPYHTSLWSTLVKPKFMWKPQWSSGGDIYLPAIITKTEKIFFLETARESEQEWVSTYLDGKIVTHHEQI